MNDPWLDPSSAKPGQHAVPIYRTSNNGNLAGFYEREEREDGVRLRVYALHPGLKHEEQTRENAEYAGEIILGHSRTPEASGQTVYPVSLRIEKNRVMHMDDGTFHTRPAQSMSAELCDPVNANEIARAVAENWHDKESVLQNAIGGFATFPQTSVSMPDIIQFPDPGAGRKAG